MKAKPNPKASQPRKSTPGGTNKGGGPWPPGAEIQRKQIIAKHTGTIPTTGPKKKPVAMPEARTAAPRPPKQKPLTGTNRGITSDGYGQTVPPGQLRKYIQEQQDWLKAHPKQAKKIAAAAKNRKGTKT